MIYPKSVPILSQSFLDICSSRSVSDKVCFLEGGILYGAGPHERFFKDPESERTRALPGRTIEAGRHWASPTAWI